MRGPLPYARGTRWACWDCAEVLAYALISPWWLPRLALEHPHRSFSAYNDYPYAADEGLVLYPTQVASLDPAWSAQVQEPAMRLAATQQYASQYEVNQGFTQTGATRTGVGIRLMTPSRWELDSDWQVTQEDFGVTANQMLVGSNHLTFRFAHNEWVQFRTGLGTRHFIDSSGHELGFDLMYGFEAFPFKPIVLSGSGNVGSVGDALVLENRLALGAMLGPLEARAGYHYLSIGDATFAGPFVGLRLWH